VSAKFLPCRYCVLVLMACAGFAGCARDEEVSSIAPVVGGGTDVAPVEEDVVVKPSIALLDAAWAGDVVAVRQHIAAGTDLNLRGEDGGTSLNAAAARGNDEVALLLIEAGADVNAKKADGATALHTAAFLCHEKVVRALLANGADKNMRNAAGATAYDGVAAPFEAVKPIYDFLQQVMGPLGLELDYERIKAARPNIAETLSAQ